jgi:hypothetical protein
MILETDSQVTYDEDEKIQDEEYESVMIYCWVPKLPWDIQLWKISVCMQLLDGIRFLTDVHTLKSYIVGRSGDEVLYCRDLLSSTVNCIWLAA